MKISRKCSTLGFCVWGGIRRFREGTLIGQRKQSNWGSHPPHTHSSGISQPAPCPSNVSLATSRVRSILSPCVAYDSGMESSPYFPQRSQMRSTGLFFCCCCWRCTPELFLTRRVRNVEVKARADGDSRRCDLLPTQKVATLDRFGFSFHLCGHAKQRISTGQLNVFFFFYFLAVRLRFPFLRNPRSS